MIERVLLAASVSPLLNGTNQQHAPQSYSIGMHNRHILEGKKRQLHPNSISCQQNFVTTRVKCYTKNSEKDIRLKNHLSVLSCFPRTQKIASKQTLSLGSRRS